MVCLLKIENRTQLIAPCAFRSGMLGLCRGRQLGWRSLCFSPLPQHQISSSFSVSITTEMPI